VCLPPFKNGIFEYMNKKNLNIPQLSQETAFSCLPACLQQVFGYYHIVVSQEEMLNELKKPERGMSIPKAGLFLKKYGFKPLIITNNIQIFDPAWFRLSNVALIKNIKKRRQFLDKYNQSLIDDYVKYLKMGGQINFETISLELFVKYLSKNIPIVAELASTFLYKKSKSTKPGRFDGSIKGDIDGHCVVIAGFNDDKIKVVDPDAKNNPFNKKGIYWIQARELIASIFVLEGKSLLLARKK